MADDNARELKKREDRAFGAKENLHNLWQELALNFYPVRADFTSEPPLGEEYAVELFDSEPLRCRRDLADARSAMLRPDGQKWVAAKFRDKKLNERPDIALVLEHINEIARSFFDDPGTGFIRSEKEVDNDETTFGNAVQTVDSEINRDGKRVPMVRTWHPRDCAWYDDMTGMKPDVMFRKFKASARHIKAKFPDATLHKSIERALENNPDQKFDLCHVMMPAIEYDWYKKPTGYDKQSFASIYYDATHSQLLRESASKRFRYVVRRWMTIPGSQYGYSPAAMTALPDARGLQAMVMVLQEAGEKSLDPPLKATKGAVVSDINLGAGSIIWVDKAYDERQGPAIEALVPDHRNIPIGIDLINRTTLALREGWYLSNLKLPETDRATVMEVSARVQDYIRANLPLFSTWQNGLVSIIDEVYDLLYEMKKFGPMDNWPREFSGETLDLIFKNPLHDAIEQAPVFQGQQIFGAAAALEQLQPGIAKQVWNLPKIAQDYTRGTGAPADWLHDEQETADAVNQTAQAGNVVGALGAAQQAADVANTGADAAQKITDLARMPAANGQGVFGPT